MINYCKNKNIYKFKNSILNNKNKNKNKSYKTINGLLNNNRLDDFIDYT